MKAIPVFLFIFFTTLTNLSSLQAQEEAEDQLGAWYIIGSSNKVADKWTVTAEVQFRYYEIAGEIERFKARVGLKYNFNKNVSARVGHAYFRVDPSYLGDLPKNFDEHRIYEEVTVQNLLGKFRLSHRYRLEHRFFSVDEIETSHFIRYMVQLVYPLTEKVSLDLYDEVFLNAEQPFFALNWLGGGVSYQISAPIKVRLGYFRDSRDGPDFDRLMLSINFKTDLRRKE